jgi:hypothetical protein
MDDFLFSSAGHPDAGTDKDECGEQHRRRNEQDWAAGIQSRADGVPRRARDDRQGD